MSVKPLAIAIYLTACLLHLVNLSDLTTMIVSSKLAHPAIAIAVRLTFAAGFIALAATTASNLQFVSGAHAQDHGALPPRDPDVEFFIQNNQELFGSPTPLTTEEVEGFRYFFGYMAVSILSLDLCAERWNDFEGQADEARRRVELLERVYVQTGSVSAETLQEIKAAAQQTAGVSNVKDYLLSDLDGLYQSCQQAMYMMFSRLNFVDQ